MSWLVLLVIQPVLISSGRAQWHRRIGKVSYLLGPLLIVFLFLAGRESYWKIMASSTERDALGFLALDSRGLISFIVFWTMAMVKRKIPAAHMRYMIATGILAIGPGVGRGLVNSFNVDFSTAFTLLDSLNLVLAGALLAIDVWKRQDPRPYLVVFFMLLLGAVLWQIRDSGWWQSLAKVYAAALY
jgi:hypothetical protein